MRRLAKRKRWAVAYAAVSIVAAVGATGGYGYVMWRLAPIKPITVETDRPENSIRYTAVGELAAYSGPLLLRIGGFLALLLFLKIALEMHRYHLLLAQALSMKFDVLALGNANSEQESHYSDLLTISLSFHPAREVDSFITRTSQLASQIAARLNTSARPPHDHAG